MEGCENYGALSLKATLFGFCQIIGSEQSLLTFGPNGPCIPILFHLTHHHRSFPPKIPRVKKLTQHLRRIARKAGPLPILEPVYQEQQEENVTYVPVIEGHEIWESSRDREEWNDVLAEPDSDGPAEDDTDDEDWQEVRRTLEYNGEWSELLTSMRLAAASVKTTKPRDGTTRQNSHHRKMVLKRAAVGTPPLSTFGFTVPTLTARRQKRVVQVAEPSGKVTGNIITVYLLCMRDRNF